jgi:hypothetical protein
MGRHPELEVRRSIEVGSNVLQLLEVLVGERHDGKS